MLLVGRGWEWDLLGSAGLCWTGRPLGGVGFSGLYFHCLPRILCRSWIVQGEQTLKTGNDERLPPPKKQNKKQHTTMEGLERKETIINDSQYLLFSTRSFSSSLASVVSERHHIK